ncbi:neuropeptide-like protein 31 [Daphnia magna]|uniref:Uncharacterized protein n=2 Tax=Daphnia magna TaxID=35525 RepID=A0ABQ9YVT4_9CRUS|nr:neuropeptide-like protein 31 [Daphnia magna]KAK4004757.1 hypothetical protein OUZ56_006482 [Daphnia magna]KZS17935.1 Uncharacterized protein APZ42_015916 [Daphnia magna]
MNRNLVAVFALLVTMLIAVDGKPIFGLLDGLFGHDHHHHYYGHGHHGYGHYGGYPGLYGGYPGGYYPPYGYGGYHYGK